jgi:hypothetical protein
VHVPDQALRVDPALRREAIGVAEGAAEAQRDVRAMRDQHVHVGQRLVVVLAPLARLGGEALDLELDGVRAVRLRRVVGMLERLGELVEREELRDDREAEPLRWPMQTCGVPSPRVNWAISASMVSSRVWVV